MGVTLTGSRAGSRWDWEGSWRADSLVVAGGDQRA